MSPRPTPARGACAIRDIDGLARYRHFPPVPDHSGTEGRCVMRGVQSLLRNAPAKIGRRLAQIVAIAAASLPQAGA
ncbi:hypothetical protein chiPu_0030645 [Chiloscyllium punctatum]|uniref:Uncharacterized protein n=1 Tax=Chiloscyllium punctatum TaxID=137246 RepID=A0A401TUA1_CHIPU|nr:hypothetical protein [Chiloscyllium punctatum]